MADRNALSRATDSSDSPTPGYLYLDIAKSAAASPAACAETATYLTRRLSSKSNHNIKYKCLKVITQVAVSPVTRGQFKRAIAQDPHAMSAVKEALQFRGPPDPIRGDEIYSRVRTAAKEALDSIYSDDPTSNTASFSSANAGLGGGGGGGAYGGASSSYSGGGGYSGGGPPSDGPRRMEGIGNPMYKDPRNDPASGGIGSMTIGEAVSVAGETLAGMIKDPLAKNVPMPNQNHNRSGSMPSYGAPSAGGYGGSAPPFAAEIARSTGGEYSGASNRGPNAVVPGNFDRDSSYYKKPSNYDWAKQSSASSAPAPSGVGGTWGSSSAGGPSIASQAREPPMQNRQASYGAPQNSGTIGSATGGVAASDGTYEKNLILDLCPAGGMKAEPPPDKLASFIRSVPSLNSDLVCPALLDCLEDGQPWIIKAKALCVIDATIVAARDAALANGATDGANAYSDFFHACAGEIEPLASHPRPAIRDPARRALKSLGIDFTANGEGGASAAASRRKAPAAAPTQAPVEPPNLLDFGDDVSTPAVTTAAAPAPQPESAPPASSGGSSLFGGLNTKDTPKPVAAPAPPQQAPPLENVELLLGDPEPAQAPSSTEVGGDGGLFGDITVKVTSSTDNNSGVGDVAGASASNGSAFGFINNAGSGDGGEKAAPSPSAPKQSFDPLEGLDTSSSQQHSANSSQMSAQVQAMAYQQNMMMMQQQMQQMQMAMAMQQQQMGGAGGANMMRQSMPSHPVNPHVMQSHLMKQTPGHGNASSSFSFLDGSSPVAKKEIKSFDFVKDAMKDAK